ncbi:hypothetical protein PZB74_07470 [Porifericola rhodea]|uniref:hypothetical protein n=1 Tax=Porifericola rhodea TaxID=930972 RepID=UPI0026671813|nr:hypothetical protein [Porifericola rhodea]WKN33181.1 hypothetical protein PZB74_07470 [Porifericola rhodea]
MKVLISIQLAKQWEEVTFMSEAEESLKLRYPFLNTFSLDNFSSADMLDYALEMMNKSERLLVLVESHHEHADLHKLLRFFNILIRKQPNAKVILLGKHKMLEKMAKGIKDNFYLQPDKEARNTIADCLFV